MENKGMVTNDTLSAKQDALSAQIGEVKAQINAFGTIYVRSDLLDLRFKELDSQIATIHLNIANVEKSTQVELANIAKTVYRANWKSHFLTAVFTAVVVLLATYAVTGFIHK